MATGADSPRPCVFLDRDGTLVEDSGYVHRVEDLRILPGVSKGLAALRSAGYWLIVLTNQSGVARGYYDEPAVERFHAALSLQLGAAAAPDAYYYCPFHPAAVSERYRRVSRLRKPDIGMVELACRDFAIDVAGSYMIGDQASDVELAHRAGIRALWLPGPATVAEATPEGCRRCPDFADATRHILDQARTGPLYPA
ncbi:MAG: HAD-IIIA family hydrolase [Polyangiales bacterium]